MSEVYGCFGIAVSPPVFFHVEQGVVLSCSFALRLKSPTSAPRVLGLQPLHHCVLENILLLFQPPTWDVRSSAQRGIYDLIITLQNSFIASESLKLTQSWCQLRGNEGPSNGAGEMAEGLNVNSAWFSVSMSGVWQLPVTLAPGGLVPSSGLLRHCPHMHPTSNILIHIIKKKRKRESLDRMNVSASVYLFSYSFCLWCKILG